MIHVIGTILGSSGYDIHTRQLVNALDKQTEVRLTTQVFPGFERLINDRELEMLKRKPEVNETTLIITSPMAWKLNLGTGINLCYCVWEGSHIPKSWIEEMMNPRVDYILVPSEHTKKAILNTWMDWINEGNPEEYKETLEMMNRAETNVIRDKIVIIPHGVNTKLFYSKEKPKDKFRFIANKGFRNLEDRGGIQYLIKAYLEEFTSKDNVELLIKLNPAYGIPDMNKLVKQLAPRDNDLPPINFNPLNLKYEELVNFYNLGQVFVSPTRAEAFNIPCLEAMACGLPCITTNFGGQTDYVNDINGYIIGGQITPVMHDLMYEGISWLTPNITPLKAFMRHCYNNPQEVAMKGNFALSVARNMSWDESAKKILNLIN